MREYQDIEPKSMKVAEAQESYAYAFGSDTTTDVDIMTSSMKRMTFEDIDKRIALAEQQVRNGHTIPASEAHRIMRSHILGLD